MRYGLDLDDLDDVKKYSEALARAGREAVKWETRKLQWIRQEKAKPDRSEVQAA